MLGLVLHDVVGQEAKGVLGPVKIHKRSQNRSLHRQFQVTKHAVRLVLPAKQCRLMHVTNPASATEQALHMVELGGGGHVAEVKTLVVYDDAHVCVVMELPLHHQLLQCRTKHRYNRVVQVLQAHSQHWIQCEYSYRCSRQGCFKRGLHQ